MMKNLMEVRVMMVSMFFQSSLPVLGGFPGTYLCFELFVNTQPPTPYRTYPHTKEALFRRDRRLFGVY